MNDDLAIDRSSYLLMVFLEAMKDNRSYIKVTEVSVDFLLKCAGRIIFVRDWLFSKNKEIRWIENWIKENSYQIRQGYVHYKKMAANFAEFVPGSRTNVERTDFFKKLMKGQMPVLVNEWDSDEEIQKEELETQRKIDFFDTMLNKWVRGVVHYNFFGLLCVRVENTMDKSYKLVETCSDLIAPEGTRVIKYNNRP
jgi:hypothetical protein